MRFFNVLGKIERIRFLLMLFAVGVIFAVISGIVLSLPSPELTETEGVILRIESDSNDSSEPEYRVFVSYTDNAGVIHESVPYPSYSSTMKEGDKVTVLYNPAVPEEIGAPGGALIPYIFLAIGLVAVAASMIGIVIGIKKTKDNSPFENISEPVDPLYVGQVQNSEEPTNDYYFHWTGKLNQSYVLETPARVAVYEAICDHIGVFTPYRYTFADRKTGINAAHKISHTVTKRYGSGTKRSNFTAVSSSRFKIDDVDCWEYLGRLGYAIEPQLNGIKLNFTVKRYGMPVAYLEAAGANILKDGKKNPLGDKLPAEGLFKIACREEDVAGVFFAAFCASRVEFF